MRPIIFFLLGVLLAGMTHADDDLTDKANDWFQASNWTEAAKAYRTLVQNDPGNGQYWQRLAVSHLNLEQFALAVDAYEQVLEGTEGAARNPIHFGLARAEAGLDSLAGVVRHLSLIADSGGTPYQAVVSTPELIRYQGQKTFDQVLLRLRPCQTEQHRAFDFWLGQWQVTSPARPDWQATSSITLGNGGCTIHEAYTTPGGYAGTSVNFFDAQKARWHQTWIDNQGGPLYLEGTAIEDGMQLGDGSNRITWTKQPDGRVRQHWEVTRDNGQTYATAFDGYYQKVNN